MTNPRRQVVRINAPGVGRMRAQNPDAASIPSRSTLNGAKLDKVKLEAKGPVALLFSQDLSSYDVQEADRIIVCSVSTGNITVNLPPAALNGGRVLTIKKLNPDAPSVIVQSIAPDTLDGAAFTLTMNAADRACLVLFAVADNQRWCVVSTFGTIV